MVVFKWRNVIVSYRKFCPCVHLKLREIESSDTTVIQASRMTNFFNTHGNGNSREAFFIDKGIFRRILHAGKRVFCMLGNVSRYHLKMQPLSRNSFEPC